MVSLSQRRLAEGIDLSRLQDDNTARFADAVIGNLKQATETIGQPNADKASEVVAAKAEIEMLAAAARKSMLDKLRLGDLAECAEFPAGHGPDEQSKQVAHFSRAIAKREASSTSNRW